MKTKEFIKRVKNLGFDVKNSYDDKYFLIKCANNNLIGVISKNVVLKVCIDSPAWDYLSDDDKTKLFDLIVEYAKTPVDEREEDTKDKLLNEINRILNYVKDFDNKGLMEVLNSIEKLEDNLEIFANDLKDF